METLLKGSFSLLAFKSPAIALKVSACNITLFFKLFEQVVAYKQKSAANRQSPDAGSNDFKKIFNCLFETVRGLLIYAKELKHDQLFLEEGIVPLLSQVILECFIKHGTPLFCDLLSQEVSGKRVHNDDKLLDLLNFTIGTIKCFTMSNRQVQEESIKHKLVQILSHSVKKLLEFPSLTQKKAMILVQVTGALRNLANVESAHYLLGQQAVPLLC